MGTRGKDIYELEQKIRIIAEVLRELGHLKNPSRREFATYAGISYDGLKAAWGQGRLSTDLEKIIAKSTGFDTSDPTWKDSDVRQTNRSVVDRRTYSGRDTAINFREMLRRRNNLVEIVRIHGDRPQLIDSNLLTFSVDASGQGSAIDQPTPLFFNAVLELGFSPNGFIYGFRRVRLRLIFNDESRIRIKDRLGAGKSVEIGAALLTVRGDEHHSEWILYKDPALQGEFATTNDPLCNLIGFAVDEQFDANVSVRPLDGTLVGPDGCELPNRAKQRIIELLSSKRLQSTPDTHGWISLGSQKLRIVRGDST